MTTQNTGSVLLPGSCLADLCEIHSRTAQRSINSQSQGCQAHPESQALLTTEQKSAKSQRESPHIIAGVVPNPASWAASIDTVTMRNTKCYQTKSPKGKTILGVPAS